MCITNIQKEKEREILVPPISSCHVSYKYNFSHLFLHRTPSFLFSLFISLSSALLLSLYYGWFTLFYFFKFSCTNGVEDCGNSIVVVEVCRSPEVVIEEVINGDCLLENDIVLHEEEIEEKEIMEIEKMAEERIEEEAIVEEEKTEDLLKPDVDQDCREVSLVRPPPWWSLCGMLEVFFQQRG